MPERLIVQGAREHNLQSVDLDLPREKLIVFTGISGSGKSSLIKCLLRLYEVNKGETISFYFSYRRAGNVKKVKVWK